jgi:hypothetical protein
MGRDAKSLSISGYKWSGAELLEDDVDDKFSRV